MNAGFAIKSLGFCVQKRALWKTVNFVSFGPGLYVYPPELSPIRGTANVGHHGWHMACTADVALATDKCARLFMWSPPRAEPPKRITFGPQAIGAESRELLDIADGGR